ncbi:E3 ubiquitin-protein ligase TRIM21-like [Oncorhynchus tshawytscha]|uniref:E3 ubiquitin-protein ligase TRIM21-like n=1 Tax=Oncorhynchus tshawytscha TaxID=74940 RepID=UPI001C3D8A76|nr:E3 ubiquitin-protein ligase TRIM21-like [Oncorhynchus tshawytscha]
MKSSSSALSVWMCSLSQSLSPVDTTNDLCQCPLCMEKFRQRPELQVNTLISEMAAQLKKLAPVEATPFTPGQAQTTTLAKSGEVPCDVCTDTKLVSLKSCLVCLASYCETHLEPHQRVASFKKHKLIDPVENLEDRVCKKHERPLELFCRSDQMCVCQFCTETDHKTHKTVPIEEEYRERKTQMRKTKGKVQEMIQERLLKVKEIKHAVELSKRDVKREIAAGVEVFTAMVRCIEKSQAELIEVVEGKQKAAERRAEGLIEELEQEITELKRGSTELEQLSDIEDHLPLLHSSPSLCTTLPHTKNWSEICVHSSVGVGTLGRFLSQLEETLGKEMKNVCVADLKKIQQYAVDVTLDPDTAYAKLILSKDRKQVRYGDKKQNLPANPERFDYHTRVLGKDGFSSGRFYYEVQVKGRTSWGLGMARESINRKGVNLLSLANGYWALGLENGDEYEVCTGFYVPLTLREKPQKVGVFVDYEEGQVSFYNVEARSHIYSFTGCTFTERLHPLFSTGYHPSNTTPLIISPIKSD